MYRFRVLEGFTLCAPLVPLVEFFTALHCWEIETRRPRRLSGSHFQPGNDQNYDRKLKYQFPYEIQGWRGIETSIFFTIIVTIVASKLWHTSLYGDGPSCQGLVGMLEGIEIFLKAQVKFENTFPDTQGFCLLVYFLVLLLLFGFCNLFYFKFLRMYWTPVSCQRSDDCWQQERNNNNPPF